VYSVSKHSPRFTRKLQRAQKYSMFDVKIDTFYHFVLIAHSIEEIYLLTLSRGVPVVTL
jgi:hypothetical protein